MLWWNRNVLVGKEVPIHCNKFPDSKEGSLMLGCPWGNKVSHAFVIRGVRVAVILPAWVERC